MGNAKRSNGFAPQNELGLLSSQVSVRIFNGVDASICLHVPKKKGLWPAIMQVLLTYNIEVVNATLTTHNATDSHSIHCKLQEDSGLESEDVENLIDEVCVQELGIKPCRV